jgi:hypothetical protein
VLNVPRLPPKWRRLFWRWHDGIFDACETDPGRAIVLLIIAVCCYALIIWREGAEWDWPLSFYLGTSRPTHRVWQDTLPTLWVLIALAAIGFRVGFSNERPWTPAPYLNRFVIPLATFIWVLALMFVLVESAR